MIMAVFFGCFSAGRERRTSAGSEVEFNTTNVTHRGSGPVQAEIVCVELLKRSNEPLGLKLEGGTDHDQPVKVAQLYPGGVAYMSGALQVGDRVLSINGTVTDRLTHSEVAALLDNSGNIVNLEIAFEASGIQKIDDGMELKTAFITMSCDPSLFPGFVISGGRLENRPITVSHVKQGSYAYKKGILRAGDRILQINGMDMRGASRSEADQLLVPSSDGLCTLQIEYDIPVHDGLESTNGPLIVELQKPHGASLGISLRDERDPGDYIVISRIREAGIADRIGILHCGDRLLSINGEKLIEKTVQEARHLLSHSDITVKLEVMLAHNFADASSARRPASPPADDVISQASSRGSHSVPIENQRRPSQLSLISATSSNQVMTHPEIMSITLSADPIGFGIKIEGGTDEYSSYPVIISEIFPNGPAAILGKLLEGDRILSINGESLCDVSLDHASKLIKEADDTLAMEVEFDVVDSSVVPTSGIFEVSLLKAGYLNLGISIRKSGDKVWISDLKKGGIAYRSGSLKAGDILLTINGVSVVNGTPHEAAALLTKSGERITLSVRREATNNFMPSKQMQSKSTPVIYAVELTKSYGDSLGISLDGSEHPGQPIVISKIREGGVAHRTGAIKVGDRIIAINGESLLTKTIDDASWILRNAGNTVTLKISKGVVRRRPRPKMTTSSNRYYKQQRYNNRFKAGTRIPSRISHSSESELSASFTSLEGSLPYLVDSRYPVERRGPPLANGGVSGRYSPSRGPRGSGRGRLSPTKERTSPNRERNGGVKMVGRATPTGGGEPVGFHRLSLTETTDEETQEEPGLHWEPDNRQPLAVRNGNYSNKSPRSPLVESSSSWKKMATTQNPAEMGTPTDQDTPSSHPLPPPPPSSSEQEGGQNGTFEVKMLETIHRSHGFTQKLRHLAQSGSSAEESDQELGGLYLYYPPPTHSRPPGEQLIEVTVIKERDFGFSLSDGLSEPGVYINQINPEGPAAHSGLQSFDRIIEFNGMSVRDYDCFQLRPFFSKTDTIVLTVLRKSLASRVGNGAAAKALTLPPTASPAPSLPVYSSSLTDEDH